MVLKSWILLALRCDLQLIISLATEEDILSPMWGLRARPDASAVVKIEYQHHNMNQNLQRDMQQDKKSGRYVSPLELKTGNPHQSHQAQALLYARAFMDRYGGDTNVIGPTGWDGSVKTIIICH